MEGQNLGTGRPNAVTASGDRATQRDHPGDRGDGGTAASARSHSVSPLVDDAMGEVEACTQGQTPDEMYFGTGDQIPEELEALRRSALAERLATNRSVACDVGQR